MKQKKSVILERRVRIKKMFSEQQELRVSQISEQFGISPLTARRDFDALAEDGFIERTHGGGKLLAKHSDKLPLFDDKYQTRQHQKRQIASYVASLVNEGDTIFLNAGSTTLEIIRQIRQNSVVIVTNNAMASAIMGDCRASLISTGGEYNPHNQSYTGLMAASLLQRMNGTLCILGVNGITCREGITTSHFPETIINEEMLKRCRGRHIVAADGSKIGKIYNFSSSSISSIDILVTDSSADPQELKKIQAAGVNVVLADRQLFK